MRAEEPGPPKPAPRRSRLSPRLVIFLTVTVDLIGFGIVIPLLPLYAKSLGASGLMIGVLFASYSLMQFLFAPVWGRLSDRVGRKPVLLGSIAVTAAAFLVFALAQSYWWLLAARLAAGMGTANLAVATAYIADITRPEERAKGMGLIGAAFGIGFVLGPALGGELGELGFAAPILAAAILAALNLGSAALLLPESLPRERRGVQPARGLVARFAVLRTNRRLGRVVSLVLMHTVAFSMLEMAFALFAARRLGFDVRHSGRVFAYIGVVSVVVQGALIGQLVRAWGETWLARAGLLAMAVGLMLIPATPAGAWQVLVAIITIVAAGSAIVTPSLHSLVSRSASVHEQGLALGLSQSAGALARVVGPIAGGLLFDRGSENMPFFAGGLLMLAAWAVSRWLLAAPAQAAATRAGRRSGEP